jgi:O-antigen/teichoic acid export membrane protein
MSTSLKRNTLFNLAGGLFPLVVSLITVPLFLRLIGDARYGVLAIVWVFVGYFGVFDFGLSRTMAYEVAKLRDAPPTAKLPVFWTATWLNLLFGILGAAALYFSAEPLLSHYFKMPDDLRHEALAALPWIAACVPLTTLSGVLIGTLEGCERFATVNVMQVSGALAAQVAPLAAFTVWGPSLTILIPAIVLSRALVTVALAAVTAKSLPVTTLGLPVRSHMRRLLAYGSWVSVSGLLGPLLEALDRLVVGVIVGAKAVAHYSVAFNLVEKTRIIPGALSRSLFPRLSNQGVEASNHLANRALAVIGRGMALMIGPGILLVGPFLTLWLGNEFASSATPIAQILLIGMWVNGVAFVPFILLQSRGRPDTVAKLHALEFLPFVGVLWLLTEHFGATGAACAWTLRCAVDAGLLLYAAEFKLKSIFPLIFEVVMILLAWTVAHVVHPLPAISLVLSAILAAVALHRISRVEPLLWDELLRRLSLKRG